MTKKLRRIAVILLVIHQSNPCSADLTVLITKPSQGYQPELFSLLDNNISIRLGKDSAEVEACFHFLSDPLDTSWEGRTIDWAWPIPSDWEQPINFQVFSQTNPTKMTPEELIEDYRSFPCRVPESFEIPNEKLRISRSRYLGVDQWFFYGERYKYSSEGYRLSVETVVTYTQPYNQGEDGAYEFRYILQTGSFKKKIAHLRIDTKTERGVHVLNSTWELQDGTIDIIEVDPSKDLKITLAVDDKRELFPVSKCEGEWEWYDGEYSPIRYRNKSVPSSLILQLPRFHDWKEVYVDLFNSEGRRLLGPVLISDHKRDASVYTGDLNHDGIQDFIVRLDLGSTLLEAQWDRVAFILSGEGTHKVTVLQTKNFDLADLVDIGGKGICQFKQNLLLPSKVDKSRETLHHSMSIIYEIKGSEMVEANHFAPGHPIWSDYVRGADENQPEMAIDEEGAALWKENQRLARWEVDEEYKDILSPYWGKVLEKLSDAEDIEDLRVEQELVKEILEASYQKTHPATMLTEERTILDNPNEEHSRQRLKKKIYMLKQNPKELGTLALRRVLDLENPSDRDYLFLLRLYRFSDKYGQFMEFLNTTSFSG